jgi:hypothetical protein
MPLSMLFAPAAGKAWPALLVAKVLLPHFVPSHRSGRVLRLQAGDYVAERVEP